MRPGGPAGASGRPPSMLTVGGRPVNVAAIPSQSRGGVEGETAVRRHLGLLLVGLLLSTGCGPAIYTIHVMPAAQAVEQAREAGAPEHAPYEYYYAREHLDKAREEASEASYQDASRFAGIAEEQGVEARELARRRLREMGR